MTNDTSTSPPSSPHSQPLPWLLIVGLASLAVLWPLTALWQLGHGLPRALSILGVTATVWIAVVGFGRVRRPVVTLTIAGVLHGFVGLVLAGFVSGADGLFGDLTRLWIFIPALLINTGAGALTGLAALGVQKTFRTRALGTIENGESNS